MAKRMKKIDYQSFLPRSTPGWPPELLDAAEAVVRAPVSPRDFVFGCIAPLDPERLREIERDEQRQKSKGAKRRNR